MVLYEIFTVGKLKGLLHAFTRIGFQNLLNTRNQGLVFRCLRLYLSVETVSCRFLQRGMAWMEMD